MYNKLGKSIYCRCWLNLFDNYMSLLIKQIFWSKGSWSLMKMKKLS